MNDVSLSNHQARSGNAGTPPSRRYRLRGFRMLRNAGDRLLRSRQLDLSQQTPYEIIHQQQIFQLRFYASSVGGRQPLVIVPPLAVNMSIYDLFPDRSLVRALCAAGHPVYLIDWGRPGRQQSHYRLRHYLQDFLPEMLSRVRQHSGERRLSLHGWSMGAIFCYAYAALGDPDLESMVLLGPPCDYHAPGPTSWSNRLISQQLGRLRKTTGLSVYHSPRQLWHAPGWANALGFKLLSPAGTMLGLLELARHLDDREFVQAHATNAAFLNGMVAYPGGVMQDIVQFLISDNVLARGRLPIRGCRASLADVRCKTLLVVGDKDPIVTPAASRRLVEQLSQAQCEVLEVPGGHMSIVSGRQAPASIWPAMLRWLDGASLADPAHPSPVPARVRS